MVRATIHTCRLTRYRRGWRACTWREGLAARTRRVGMRRPFPRLMLGVGDGGLDGGVEEAEILADALRLAPRLVPATRMTTDAVVAGAGLRRDM